MSPVDRYRQRLRDPDLGMNRRRRPPLEIPRPGPPPPAPNRDAALGYHVTQAGQTVRNLGRQDGNRGAGGGQPGPGGAWAGRPGPSGGGPDEIDRWLNRQGRRAMAGGLLSGPGGEGTGSTELVDLLRSNPQLAAQVQAWMQQNRGTAPMAGAGGLQTQLFQEFPQLYDQYVAASGRSIVRDAAGNPIRLVDNPAQGVAQGQSISTPTLYQPGPGAAPGQQGAPGAPQSTFPPPQFAGAAPSQVPGAVVPQAAPAPSQPAAPVAPGAPQSPLAGFQQQASQAAAQAGQGIGLPLTGAYEQGVRQLEDNLSRQLAGLGVAWDQIPAMVNLVTSRLGTDQGQATDRLREQMNARGIYGSGIQMQDQRQLDQGFGRARQDLAFDAAGQQQDLSNQMGEAYSAFQRELQDFLLELGGNLAEEGPPTLPGGDIPRAEGAERAQPNRRRRQGQGQGRRRSRR